MPPGGKPCRAWICSGLVRCIREYKIANFVQQKLELHDIVFILLEIVARRAYGFYFEHFILSCFSSHIRENSRDLRPHPPLTRSPFPEHGEGFFSSRSPAGDATGIPRLRAPSHGEGLCRGPLTGMPPASRACAPPLTEKAFLVRGPLPGMPPASRACAPPLTEKAFDCAVPHSPEPSPEGKVPSLRGG